MAAFSGKEHEHKVKTNRSEQLRLLRVQLQHGQQVKTGGH